MKVLIIEDELFIRENIIEILQLNGIEAYGAHDGASGVEMACKLKPNLVICDILMDGVDGYGVLNMLRSDPRTAGIPLIFVTGVADRQAIHRAKQAGVSDYLVKPFTQTELLDIVERQM